MYLGIEDLLTFDDLIPEDNLLRAPEELQHGQEFPTRCHVVVNGGVDPGAKHLTQIAPRDPAGRNVVDVRLGPKLWVEGQGHVGLLDQIVERVAAVLLPSPIFIDVDQSLQADLAHAGPHAACFHGTPVRGGILALDTRVATDAFLRDARLCVVHGLLVGAGLHALAIAPTAFLVNQHDAVFGPLVDGLAGTGRQTGRVGAVIANTLQIEEPCLVLGQGHAAVGQACPSFRLEFCGGVFVEIGRTPFLLLRQVAQDLLAGGRGFKDGLSGKQGFVGPRVALPNLTLGIGLVLKLQNLGVPVAGIAAIGLALDIVPPHVLLPLGEGPGGLAGHGTGLAGDASIDIEDSHELLRGMSLLIGVVHAPPKLPIIDFGHCESPSE